MSTFSGGYGPEEEDGAGWSGLVESAAERRERQKRERELNNARLQGRLEAYAKAMTECSRMEPAGFGLAERSRSGPEARKAIDMLHLATLQELKSTKASNTELSRPRPEKSDE